MLTVNQFIENESINRMQILEEYKNTAVKQMIPLLRDMAEDIRGRINSSTLTSYQERRINALLNEINKTINASYRKIGSTLDQELKNIIPAELNFSQDLLHESVGVAFTARPTINQVYAAAKANPFNGHLLEEYYRDVPASVADSLARQIRIGYSSNEATQTIVNRVKGVLNGEAAAWTETLTRTAVTHFQVATNQQLYMKNSRNLKGVTWNATLDTGTTDICSTNDGELFQIDQMNRIPAHYRCRSNWIPALKSWKQVDFDVPQARRNSMDGVLPDAPNYDQWLRRQSVERQNERLGITAATLYRKGELPISSFSTRLGKPFTLEQLQANNPAVWADVFGRSES